MIREDHEDRSLHEIEILQRGEQLLKPLIGDAEAEVDSRHGLAEQRV